MIKKKVVLIKQALLKWKKDTQNGHHRKTKSSTLSIPKIPLHFHTFSQFKNEGTKLFAGYQMLLFKKEDSLTK